MTGLIDLPCKLHCMRRLIITCLTLCTVFVADAQYIPAFKKKEKKDPGTNYWSKGNLFRHLEVSLTAGTTGVGIDLAAPLCKFMQVRIGYDYMPQFSQTYNIYLAAGGQQTRQYDDKGNRISTPFDNIEQYMYEQTGAELDDYIVMKGKTSMHNMKFLIDIYPFKYNKHWHFTTGIYYGPAEFVKAENDPQSDKNIELINDYNKRYGSAGDDDAIKGYGKITLYPGDYAQNHIIGLTQYKTGDPYLIDMPEDGKIEIRTKSNAIKPYIGFGYTGRLAKYRDDWKISAELGVMIWGGTPVQSLNESTNLSKDVIHIPGKMGKIVGVTEALKVFPVLSVRFAKTLF